MTTYSYQLDLDDGEAITLETALNLLLQECDEQLSIEPRAPYIAWQLHAQRIKTKLYEHVHQTSGNLVDPKTGEYSIWVDISKSPGE